MSPKGSLHEISGTTYHFSSLSKLLTAQEPPGEKYRSYLFTCKMELRVMPVPTESFKIISVGFQCSPHRAGEPMSVSISPLLNFNNTPIERTSQPGAFSSFSAVRTKPFKPTLLKQVWIRNRNIFQISNRGLNADRRRLPTL